MKESRAVARKYWIAALVVLIAARELLFSYSSRSVHGIARGDITELLGLALDVGALIVFILATGHCASLARKLQEKRKFLTAVLDSLEMGVEVWDQHDRLIIYNENVNQIETHFRQPEDIGKTCEDLLRSKISRCLIPDALGNEADWLQRRLDARRKGGEPEIKEFPGDRWFKMYQKRTSGGYLVTSWVDVSELVRKGRALEQSNLCLLELSSLDGLTGLANRRKFDDVLTMEFNRAARTDSSVSVLMIDIDHFKLYNDYYGHLAGDECLRRVASILRLCVRRSGELVARYGGEEFVILLPGSNLDAAYEAAQQCMEQMRKAQIPHIVSPTRNYVTLSIGIASAPFASITEPGRLLNAADAAMYRAKSGGRARYEFAGMAEWEIDKDTPRTRPIDLH